MKRVAIPISNGKLSEYFGSCNHYEIFEVTENSILKRKTELPPVKTIGELPAWASSEGITDIISYKMDKQIIMLFTQHKINLFVGITIDEPENLIHEFINERMASNHKIISEIIDN